jgi:hypothetical protein
MTQLKRGVVGGITVLVAVSLSLSAQAAQKKRISATYTGTRVVSRTTVPLKDVPNHEIFQFVAMTETTSSDPDFNQLQGLIYGQGDQVAYTGSSNGYVILFQKDGAEIYISLEGTQKAITKEAAIVGQIKEAKLRFIGGTGKFKNIKGTGTAQGMETEEGSTGNWEAEVEY